MSLALLPQPKFFGVIVAIFQQPWWHFKFSALAMWEWRWMFFKYKYTVPPLEPTKVVV